ncbi:MAG: PAS domain S-box protein, partial [Elusimicrobiota bacterium]
MTNMIIVGGRKGCIALLGLLRSNSTVKVLGVVDPDPDAAGLAVARSWDIPTATHVGAFLNGEKVHAIVNTTGSERVQTHLESVKPAGAEIIGGPAAKLLWTMMQRHELAAEAQRRAKNRAETLLDITPNAIFTVDAERRVTSWNKKAAQITGFTAEEVIGKSCAVFALDPCKNRCGLLAGDVKKPVCGKECTIRTKDGRVRHIAKNAELIRDFRGEVIGGIESFADITESKEAEKALQLTQTSVDRIQDAVFWTDDDARLIFANETTCRRLGYTRTELTAMTVFDIDPRFPREAWESYLRKIKASGSFTIESVHRAKDGRVFPVEVAVTRVKFDGKDYNFALARDITDRKVAEQVLKERTDMLRERVKELDCLHAVSSMADKPGVSLGQIAQRVTEILPLAWRHPEVACARIRIRDREYASKNFAESAWRQASDIMAGSERIGTVEVRYLEERPEEDEGPFLAEERGLIDAVARNLSDMAERFQSEDAVRAVNRFNEALLNTIPFAMDIVDEQGNILFANDKLKAALGGDIVGKKCWELYKDDKKACPDCPLKSEIKLGETKVVEAAGVLGGKTLQITHTGMVYKGRKALLEVFEDITVRKQAERELKKTMDIREGFISIVSHELRTPLTAIKEGVEIVLDGMAGEVNADQRKLLNISNRNVDRLARLINEVLDFQKLDAGRMDFRFEVDDLGAAVKEVLETMAPIARKKGLELAYKNGAVLPGLRFDRDKIIQVLTNLMNNAVKFTEKGRIAISVSRADSAVRVTVEDTGPGISQEDMPRLFNTFEQFGKAREMTGGTG